MTPIEIININTRLATKDDDHIPCYDHTRLDAINTCPTWGIVRYSMHKRMPGAGRQMALEAGTAGHDGFAAVKLFQFWKRQVEGPLPEPDEVWSSVDRPSVAQFFFHGARIFGEERFTKMLGAVDASSSERTQCISFCLEALYSGEFFDDPDDKRRTVSNISEGLIAYIDRWDMDRYPIWVRDPNDPNSDIGIEVTLNIVVTLEYREIDLRSDFKQLTQKKTFRLIGKIDGLVWDRDKLMIVENKTTTMNLADVWLSQWIMSHQITGYCITAGTWAGAQVDRALIEGMKIPMPKNIADGIRKEDVDRNAEMYRKWGEWVIHTIEIDDAYRDVPLRAPQYPHACNRYFHTCSFLPLCAAKDEQEKVQILEEMELDRWDPLA